MKQAFLTEEEQGDFEAKLALSDSRMELSHDISRSRLQRWNDISIAYNEALKARVQVASSLKSRLVISDALKINADVFVVGLKVAINEADKRFKYATSGMERF